MQQRARRGRYLDVSEFILKEPQTSGKGNHQSRMDAASCNQQLLAHSLPSAFTIQNHQRSPTPEIGPIDHDASALQITPFLNGLIGLAGPQLEDFLLDQRVPLEGHLRERRCEGGSRRRSDSLVMFHLQSELQGIVEESEVSARSASSWVLGDEEEGSWSVWSEGSQQQSAAEVRAEYREKLEKYLKEPKATLVRQVRSLAAKDELNQNQKLENIKKTIQSYFLDFQLPAFDQAWNASPSSLALKLPLLLQGLEDSFARRIGPLSFQQRRLRLLRYLQKKRLRRWRKKAIYDCRKKVADGRLRIKGKFVTRGQVCEQLGIASLDLYSGQEIRQLLEKRAEERPAEEGKGAEKL